MFKGCLKNGIIPFVILDRVKVFYIRGLKEYDNQSNYLIDSYLREQDIYESVCNQLLDFDIDQTQGEKSR